MYDGTAAYMYINKHGVARLKSYRELFFVLVAGTSCDSFVGTRYILAFVLHDMNFTCKIELHRVGFQTFMQRK